MEQLPAALTSHQKSHPDATYELYAEDKCTTEISDRIIAVISGAKITLKNYWAPVSAVNFQNAPGKYGHGYVDILKDK